jgi:hypothetical protein
LHYFRTYTQNDDGEDEIDTKIMDDHQSERLVSSYALYLSSVHVLTLDVIIVLVYVRSPRQSRHGSEMYMV